MKCSSRPTAWCAEAARVAAAIVLVLLGATARAADEAVDPAVAAAVVRAVEARIGEGFTVEIQELTARLPEDAGAIDAVPTPGARLHRAMRFALVATGAGARTRVGDAVATVRVVGPIVRLVRPVARGADITAEDVRLEEGDAGGVLLEPLPTLAAVVGARALRDLAEGEIVTATVVRIPPAVESGQLVTTIARVGVVDVEGRAVAAQHGEIGEVIRLVNPDSRRAIRGTVVGPGRVEVLREP